jgi:transcriptional repressor OPI1
VEYIERRFTPVVNTVGSVGRVTGVEGGVRWFLGGRRPSHQQQSDLKNGDHGSNKRRKVGDGEMDIDNNVSRDPYPVHRQEFQLYHRERRASISSTVESLPAYDEHRSPSYETHAEQTLITTQPDSPTSPGSTWHSRLVLSTSGLSVAMSEESLRSLKYCLSLLRWANDHIGKVIEALKVVLDQFESTPLSASNGALTNGDSKEELANGQLILRTDADRSAMHAKIAELKSDVLKTLKKVVDVVSKYAGGALPENARVLVRRHLTSLPQRFRLASTGTNQNGHAATSGDGEVTEGARKVMVLAKEGLDMMAQVSGVLDGTIVSAEEWCERLGKKKRGEAEGDDTGMLKESFEMSMTDDARPANGKEN